MPVIIRPEEALDHEGIRDVVTLAFDDGSVARLVELIRTSEHYVAELALVAEDGGVVVGHTMLSYAILERAEPVRVLLLSPVAVAPARQRQGIGAALVKAGLDRAEQRGEPLVIVEGIPAYYPRFGFERARDYGIEPPSSDVPDAAFMVRRLGRYDAALRGRIRYPPTFDTVAH
jgi:putative acetyltransferase